MDKETLRMQMLSGVITESEYIAAINQQVENAEKDSLNEHYVAGGIVGIGAINQIPSRAKADYEDAFEYFLSQKYSLNEIEKEVEEALDPKIANDPNFEKLASYFKQNPDKAKDVKDELSSLKEASFKKDGKYYIEDAYGNEKEVPFKEYLQAKLIAIGLPAAALGLVGALMAGPLGAMDPGSILQAIGIAAGIGGGVGAIFDIPNKAYSNESKVEEKSLYEAEVNENVGATIEKILQSFEFSEKGNDEMIEFANYLLSPEGPKNIAMSIKSRLKGEGGENYFTSTPDELDALLSKLK